MRNPHLLGIAFEAARFLEQGLPPEVTEHLIASDPDATENGAYIYIQVDDPAARKHLPREVCAHGCNVEVICRVAAKLEVH